MAENLNNLFQNFEESLPTNPEEPEIENPDEQQAAAQ